MIRFFLAYAVFINLLTFLLFGIDKKRAKQNEALTKRRGRGKGKGKSPAPGKPARRIPENTLFAAAILGGSPGAIVGMAVFRHKTLHPAFRYGMPAILVIQLVVIWIAVKGI